MFDYASMVPLMLHIQKQKNKKKKICQNQRNRKQRFRERKINREEEKRMCQCGGSSVGWVDEI